MSKKRERVMEVTVDFQPNRMEEEVMSTAYELILPLERKTLRSAARNVVKGKEVVEHPIQLAVFPSAAAQ